jgi:hypothetical protein
MHHMAQGDLKRLVARAVAQQIHEIGQPIQAILALQALAAMLGLLIVAEALARVLEPLVQHSDIHARTRVAGAPQRQVLTQGMDVPPVGTRHRQHSVESL